jgi:hypothetical protein
LGDSNNDYKTSNHNNYYDKSIGYQPVGMMKKNYNKINFGKDVIDYKTTNQQLNENRNEVRFERNNANENKSDLTKTHFILGEDSNDYRSVFKDTIGNSANLIGAIGYDNKSKTARIQKTHFSFGKHNSDYITSYMDQSTNLKTNALERNNKKPVNQKTNFRLGNDINNYRSTNNDN